MGKNDSLLPNQKELNYLKWKHKAANAEKLWDAVCFSIKALPIGSWLYWMYLCVDKLAGKETHLDVNVAIGVTITFSLAGVGLGRYIGYRKEKEQSAELKRLRDNCEMLERRLRK